MLPFGSFCFQGFSASAMHCLVQLTDCHLFEDPRGQLREVCTRTRLELVLAAVRQLPVAVERLVVTGDMAHDHLAATYQQLRELLDPWLPRLRLVPGNHDDRAAIQQVFADRVQRAGPRLVIDDQVGNWSLLGVDTHVPGELYGQVGHEQLAWLENRLGQHPQRPAVLFMHHPPTQVLSPWLDLIGLRDASAVRELLVRHPQLKLVCTGHVHQELTYIGPPIIVSTPATGLQFRPTTEKLELDEAAPGFRVLELHDDGSIRTRVLRTPCS